MKGKIAVYIQECKEPSSSASLPVLMTLAPSPANHTVHALLHCCWSHTCQSCEYIPLWYLHALAQAGSNHYTICANGADGVSQNWYEMIMSSNPSCFFLQDRQKFQNLLESSTFNIAPKRFLLERGLRAKLLAEENTNQNPHIFKYIHVCWRAPRCQLSLASVLAIHSFDVSYTISCINKKCQQEEHRRKVYPSWGEKGKGST